jgi:hypothetical protein
MSKSAFSPLLPMLTRQFLISHLSLKYKYKESAPEKCAKKSSKTPIQNAKKVHFPTSGNELFSKILKKPKNLHNHQST